jgi:hypothetical protein
LLGAPQVARRAAPRIVKTYDYRNEAGVLMFQVARPRPCSARPKKEGLPVVQPD